MRAARATTRIEIAILSPAWANAVPHLEARVRRAAKAALAAARADGCILPPRVEVSLALAGDRLVQHLNSTYRKRNKPTNVLSFPAADIAGPKSRKREGAWLQPPRQPVLLGDVPVLLGDVIVAFETTDAEATAQGKALGHHLAHLIVHGTLHLLGYDHERLAEARRMERLEVAILAGLGVADPYAAAALVVRRRATSRPGATGTRAATRSTHFSAKKETRTGRARQRSGK
jgi:probable rRNA maturation factor